ncbi:MAG TPA: hypothetical protein VMV44_06230 [Rectinemataceae bacterium]|nr:hypothetical protein [Rectinemataceae bacterium]
MEARDASLRGRLPSLLGVGPARLRGGGRRAALPGPPQGYSAGPSRLR